MTSSVLTRFIAVLIGMLIGGFLYALIGSASGQMLLGSIGGITIGSIVGYLVIINKISRITVGAILGASVFTIFGLGEPEGLFFVPFGAIVGIYLGYLGWIWIFSGFGAFIGIFAGHIFSVLFFSNWPEKGLSSNQCQSIGMWIGGLLTLTLGYVMKMRIDRSRGSQRCNSSK